MMVYIMVISWGYFTLIYVVHIENCIFLSASKQDKIRVQKGETLFCSS